MNKTILITGGAGYLGSTMSEHMLNQGYKVTVLDNLTYSQNSLFHLAHNPNFDFIRGDARDETQLKKIMKDFEYIIPLACIVGAPACDKNPANATSTNLDAIKLLNKLRDHDKQKIIFPTTNSGYGTKSGATLCTEETPLEPISLYGRLKTWAEQELLSTQNVITLRLATVFGMSPRMRLDLLVNDFTYKAVKDGYLTIFEKDFKRNYVHIRDVARAFQHCMENFETMKNNVYNLGLDDANLSKEELALTIKKQVPALYIHFAEFGSDPDKRNYIISNEKIMKTGFKFKHSLEQGIKELIKGYSMLTENNFKNI